MTLNVGGGRVPRRIGQCFLNNAVDGDLDLLRQIARQALEGNLDVWPGHRQPLGEVADRLGKGHRCEDRVDAVR